MKRQRRADRLSALPDETLQHILCHLASGEAVRTSVLSRRWHHVCAGVPVVHLVDPKNGMNRHDLPYENRGSKRYEPRACFDQKVTGAILCKAAGTPIRIFRLDAFNPPWGLLDQWILTAVSSGVEEMDVTLRYRMLSGRRLCPFGSSIKASADFNRCDKKSPCLRSLHYKGGLPCKSLFKIANHAGVVALKIEICEDLSTKNPTEFAPATKLIRRCPELAYLHVSLSPSMAYCSSLFTDATPCLQHLRQLGLQCCLNNDQDVRSVAVLLCDTHSLEELSLCPLDPDAPNDDGDSWYSSDSDSDTNPENNVGYIQPMEDYGVDYTEPKYDGDDYTEHKYDGEDGVDYTEHQYYGEDGVDYTEHEYDGEDGVDYTEHEYDGEDGVDYTEHEYYGEDGVDYTEHEYDGEDGVDYMEHEYYGEDGFNYTEHEYDGDHGFHYTEPQDDGFAYTEPKHDGDDYYSFGAMHIRCLDDKLKRINIHKYRGLQHEKILAKFLLSKAQALDEVSVTLMDGCFQNKGEIAKELQSWRPNQHTRVTIN